MSPYNLIAHRCNNNPTAAERVDVWKLSSSHFISHQLHETLIHIDILAQDQNQFMKIPIFINPDVEKVNIKVKESIL